MGKLFFALVSILPARALAAPMQLPTDVQSPDDFVDILTNIASWVFTFAIITSVFMVLYAAYLFLTSAGDPERTKQARDTILYAAIGIAIALVAAGFPFIVSGLLNIDLIGA